MKKILLLSVLMVFGFNLHGTLYMSNLGVNQAVIVWDTITNANSYAVVYNKGVALSNTVTANIHNIQWYELKSNTLNTQDYYTMPNLNSNCIYNAIIVPVMGGNFSWAYETNEIAFTPKTADFYTNPNNPYLSVNANANAGAGSDITITTASGGDWYISQVSTASATAGVIGIYVNSVLVDELANPTSGTGFKTYNI